jgi:hypothetical protein
MELHLKKETVKKLNQVSVFRSVSSPEELIKQYIRQGLKEDLAKIEKHKHLIRERQLQIETMFNLICGEPCPHCGSTLELTETSVLSSWGGEVIAVCYNDSCPFFSKSWNIMREQGNYHGYRFYSDQHKNTGSIPVGPAERKQPSIKLPRGFNKKKECGK